MWSGQLPGHIRVYNSIILCYLAIEYPWGKEDKWHITEHIDHAGPVDREAADIIVAHHDVGDDGVLQPVYTAGDGAEHEQQ